MFFLEAIIESIICLIIFLAYKKYFKSDDLFDAQNDIKKNQKAEFNKINTEISIVRHNSAETLIMRLIELRKDTSKIEWEKLLDEYEIKFINLFEKFCCEITGIYETYKTINGATHRWFNFLEAKLSKNEIFELEKKIHKIAKSRIFFSADALRYELIRKKMKNLADNQDHFPYWKICHRE